MPIAMMSSIAVTRMKATAALPARKAGSGIENFAQCRTPRRERAAAADAKNDPAGLTRADGTA
jgi:hypothetical protein